jgi:hypothetical protein
VRVEPEQRKEREKMSKAMTQATGVHSLKVRVAMAMIAVLLVALVALVALQPTPTAKDREA